MKLPLYIISDNHFMLEDSLEEQSRRKLLFELFEEIKKTGGTLIIGGDFFDFWVEFMTGPPLYYDDILGELETLKNNNIDIHYVAGNHDYWDYGYFTKKFGCTLHKQDFEFSINNIKILITHGDGLLKHDSGYRFMKKIIRNKLFTFFVRLIPKKLGCEIAKKISSTKKKFGIEENLDLQYKNELKEFANTKIKDQNFDVVLMGHYHQTGIENINNKYFIHLGDWINNYTVTTYDEKNQWQQKNIDITKCNK